MKRRRRPKKRKPRVWDRKKKGHPSSKEKRGGPEEEVKDYG